MTRWPNILLMLAMACGLASAQVKPVAPDGGKMQLKGMLSDFPVQDLIQLYSQYSGKKVHIAEGVIADWNLNLCVPVEGIEADEAVFRELLDGTLKRHGCALVPREDGDVEIVHSTSAQALHVDAVQLAKAADAERVRHSFAMGNAQFTVLDAGYVPRGCTIDNSTGKWVITGSAASVRVWKAIIRELEQKYGVVAKRYGPQSGLSLEQMELIATRVLRGPVSAKVIEDKLEVAAFGCDLDEFEQILSQLK